MTARETDYDILAYPSGAIPTTHPDHLAAIARLHGLTPPPVATARVLDIGGGDGMNLIAMAETLPSAEFLSIDLAAAPVARGQAIVRAAGLHNVRVETADILDAVDTLAGTFDYVIAHGVYAWSPPAVRAALMVLIGRVLAPDGVAFVSYNALPGGYYRRMVRDMTLHELRGLTDLRERGEAAKRFLHALGEPREGERATMAAMRIVAARMADKDVGQLMHDELNVFYDPQAFEDVIAAGAAQGLRFLNDAEPEETGDGFPDAAVENDAALVRAIQRHDHAELCFFHRTLFVRTDRIPARTPALDRVGDLHMSTQYARTGANVFASETGRVTISDATLADAVDAAAQAWPARVRVGDLIADELRLNAIVRLFRGGVILLHDRAYPGAATPGDRPKASGLARALVALGENRIVTLDHRVIELDDPSPRAFLTLLDGIRDRAMLAADWAGSGFGDRVSVDHALARCAAFGLMVA